MSFLLWIHTTQLHTKVSSCLWSFLCPAPGADRPFTGAHRHFMRADRHRARDKPSSKLFTGNIYRREKSPSSVHRISFRLFLLRKQPFVQIAVYIQIHHRTARPDHCSGNDIRRIVYALLHTGNTYRTGPDS